MSEYEIAYDDGQIQPKGMEIIDEADSSGDWVTAVIDGHWVQAKVFGDPSTFGVNDGRVSKLSIGKMDFRYKDKNFFNQMCYNYDRGLEFDDSEKYGVDVDSVVKKLNEYAKNRFEKRGKLQEAVEKIISPRAGFFPV